jgi:excisionase family DNA binding protein
MTQQDGEEFLTIEEASALMGRSRRTLERYASEGRIKRYRRGLRIMFKRSDVERLIEDINRIREDEPKED